MAFKETNPGNWDGQGNLSGYSILKKPLGRNRYCYHVYEGHRYVAYGTTLEDAERKAIAHQTKTA